MIEPGYVRSMAKYNAWQNTQLTRILQEMDTAALTKDHGAFFGSIFATLNHLLWGDTIWMSRFDPSVDAPPQGIPESVEMTQNFGVWSAERFRMDGKITLWAGRLSALDLTADLTWFSGAAGREITKPLATCITHFFNHQTHHRGQVHAMLTRAKHDAPVSDLFLLPEG